MHFQTISSITNLRHAINLIITSCSVNLVRFKQKLFMSISSVFVFNICHVCLYIIHHSKVNNCYNNNFEIAS